MRRRQSHWNASFNATCLVLLRDAELQVGTSRALRLPSLPLLHPRESRKASLLVRAPLASLTSQQPSMEAVIMHKALPCCWAECE